MGSLNGRLDRLEKRLDIPKTEAQREEERRKAEVREKINAELSALEARIRAMSKSEREAWRAEQRRLAAFQEFEERNERRRRQGPA